MFMSCRMSNCRVVSEYRRVRDVCGFLSHGLQTRRPCVALNIILTRADVLADLLTGVRAGVLTGVLAISFLADVLTDVLADLLTRVLADVVAGGCSGSRRGPYVVGLVNSGSFPPGRTGESKPAMEGSTRASWHAHRGPTLSYGSPRDYKLPGRGSRPIIRKPNGLINHLARVHSCNHCTKVLRARLRCML